MTRIIIPLFIAFIFILTGCNGNQNNESPTDITNVTEVTDPSDISIQSNAKQAKQIISKMDEVKLFQVVELNRDLFIALELKHQHTFQAEKIQKKLRKKLEKELPGKKLLISTDHKLFIELRKLEAKIQKNDISKNQLNKELDHLKKLLDQSI